MELKVVSHSSPLGDWQMTFALPPPGFADVASVLWDVAGVTHYSREAILPSGGIEILFNLGSDQHLLDADTLAPRARYDSVWVSGLQQRQLVVQSHGFSHLVGVRLTPLGAWRFFGLPMHEITDRVLDLDAILGRSLLDLREQLGAHADPQWRLRRIADFVMRRVQAGPEVHASVAAGLARLQASRGQWAITDLLDEVGVSQKHLIRMFQQQVGLAPKRYAQLLKFQHAVQCLHNGVVADLGELALGCGYYDQAHFNRDFRRFAGATPGEFLRRRLPDEVAPAMLTE